MKTTTSLISYLPSIILLFLFYFTYSQVYSHTSWTLLLPLLVLLVTTYGIYQCRLYKRQCIARCFLREGTWPYAVMHGRFFCIVFSLFIAFIYTVSLMSFIALDTWHGLQYVLANFVLLIFFYSLLNPVIHRWVSQNISEVITRKIVSGCAFVLIAPIYIWISFNTPIPEYVDPNSLSNTISSASQEVFIVCPLTNFIMKAVHEFNAIFFYYSTVSSLTLENNLLRFLIWMLFFVKTSFVFMAMSRFNIEVISRVSRYYLTKMSTNISK